MELCDTLEGEYKKKKKITLHFTDVLCTGVTNTEMRLFENQEQCGCSVALSLTYIS